MNKHTLFAFATAAAVTTGLAASAAAQPFKPIGPPVLAGSGYQYASNDLAYNDKQNVYLMVQGHTFVGGRFVNADGQLIGTQFNISKQSPSDAESRVAYSSGSADDVFLVTHRSELGGGTQIYGRLVIYSGGSPLVGPIVGITQQSTPRPSRQVNGGIAFDAANRRFFVTWEDYRFGAPRIFGRLWGLSGSGVNTSLVALTNDFQIGGDIAGSPNIAFDPHGTFMVVYRGPHPQNPAIFGSFARTVTFSGATPQVSGVIVLSAGNGEPGEQNVAYLPQVDRFFTFWTHITRLRDVVGRVVDHGGNPITGVYPILNTPSMEGAADAAYNPGTQSVLLAAMRDQTRYIQGIELTAGGLVPTAYDPFFKASNALPAGGLESFFPNVAAGENGRIGLGYVNSYQFGWVEVFVGGDDVGPTPPPPPPPPPPSTCTAALGDTIRSVSAASGSGSFAVTMSGSDCTWTAASSAAWLKVTEGATGTGSGTVEYTFSRNASGAPRTAMLALGGRTFTLNQAAAMPLTLTSDFTGDNLADLVWQHRTNGGLAVWRMQDTNLLSGDPLTPGTVADTGWKVVGTADFDNDGNVDILWRHDNGLVSLWFMAGSVMRSGQLITSSPLSDLGWKIVGTGDINRDGWTDIIWQHTDSRLSIWYMRGATMLAGEAISEPLSDQSWRVVGTRDMNNDGHVDFVWRNSSTLKVAIWFMRGTSLLDGVQLPTNPSDSNWRIMAIDDFDLDGHRDLVWQNIATGDLALWSMNGGTVQTTKTLTPNSVPDTEWRIVGPR